MAGGLSTCAVCGLDQDESAAAEAIGQLALSGEISWREASRQTGRTPASIKTHMEKHWVKPRLQAAKSEAESNIAKSVADLREKQRIAPPEVAPLYEVLIYNIEHIQDSKPSQQHLIQAAKAIHEISGMKLQQQMLLDFGKVAFGAVSAPSQEIIEATIVNETFAALGAGSDE